MSELTPEAREQIAAHNARRALATQDRIQDLRRERDELRAALLLVLDQVDYTVGACRFTEMVGAALPTSVIDRARKAASKPHGGCGGPGSEGNSARARTNESAPPGGF